MSQNTFRYHMVPMFLQRSREMSTRVHGAILDLPSQSAHPPYLNAGAPGCLADNILGISDTVYM